MLHAYYMQRKWILALIFTNTFVFVHSVLSFSTYIARIYINPNILQFDLYVYQCKTLIIRLGYLQINFVQSALSCRILHAYQCQKNILALIFKNTHFCTVFSNCIFHAYQCRQYIFTNSFLYNQLSSIMLHAFYMQKKIIFVALIFTNTYLHSQF